MKYKIFVLLTLMVLFMPLVFSESALSLTTSPDYSENTFYISKNISKQIHFSLVSDFSSTFQNNYRAEYDLKVYSQDLKEIKLSLSKEEEMFISNVNSSFSLNIRSLDFKDQTVNLRVSVDVYDSLNNLVFNDYIFIKLVSNNSEYEFSDAPKNKVPEYSGYSLSRDKMFILNKYDSDSITIKNHVPSIAYDVKCSTKEPALLLDLIYKGNNEYSLEVSVDVNSDLKESIHTINCYSFYKDDKHNIKTITLNYLDQNTSSLPEEEISIEKENKIKVFLNNLLEKLKN